MAAYADPMTMTQNDELELDLQFMDAVVETAQTVTRCSQCIGGPTRTCRKITYCGVTGGRGHQACIPC
jgi:hypothetical protein